MNVVRWRGVLAAGLVASAPLALASFEMALLSQIGPNGRVIHRFDAPTGRYMGSFGQGMGLTGGIDQDSVSGTILGSVWENGLLGYRRLDYSTGANLGGRVTSVGGFSYGGLFATGANGELFFAGTSGGQTQIRVYNQNMFLQRTINYGRSSFPLQIAVDRGFLYSLDRESGTSSGSKFVLNAYQSNATAPSSSLTIADNQEIDAFLSLAVREGQAVVGAKSGPSSRVILLNGASMISLGTFSGGPIENRDVAFGHGDTIYSYSVSASTGRIDWGLGNTLTRSWVNMGVLPETGGTSGIIDAHIVLAPEPGTMIALGAGFAAIVARRRKTR